MKGIKPISKVKAIFNKFTKNNYLQWIKRSLSIEMIISVLTFVLLGLSWYFVTKYELECTRKTIINNYYI